MIEPDLRPLVDEFYAAFPAGNGERLAALLHDDVTTNISGPVSILEFCGERHGKAQVLDLSCRVLQAVFRDIRVFRDTMVIDGDTAASLNRFAAYRRADGRSIRYRFAHFLRFKDGKLIELVSLVDTFDAAEQMLGHAIDVHEESDAAGPKNMVML